MANSNHPEVTLPAFANPVPANATSKAGLRFVSQDLFRQSRVVEILHGGRVYHLRLTQQNKLILTA